MKSTTLESSRAGSQFAGVKEPGAVAWHGMVQGGPYHPDWSADGGAARVRGG